MKHSKVSLFLSLGLLLLSACADRRAALTPEELRMQKIALLDSTLGDLIALDSVEGYDRLATLSAEAWLLVEDSTGFIVSQKNATQKRFIASITKMMTCLLALEAGNPGDTVCVGPGDCLTRNAWVKAGDAFLLSDLTREMMMVSDNDAAYALARHIAGDTLAFYDMMNWKARYLGMDSTHFASPNGMPSDSNYSSASDLVRLSRYCLCDSVFSQMVGTWEADLPLLDGRHMPCQNTNLLLASYEGCIGIKTGYTRQAGSCLASAARRDGHTLVLVLLGSRSKSVRFRESAILLDYGFSAMKALSERRERS